VIEGSFLAHLTLFLRFSKIIQLVSELIKCGSRVVHTIFNITLQKICAKLSKGGPHGSSEKREPEATASFVSLTILPCLDEHYAHEFSS